MGFLIELNEQANNVCNELIAAKRARKAAKTKADAAYHAGREEELQKWHASLERMITAITDRKEEQREVKAVDIDGKRKKIFICDQNCECKDSENCGTQCFHTTDPKHAKRFFI